ncbi:MAG: hypothetical protein P8X82_12405 [Gemmatimonadales bacterium]|jgi:hypothetical protein
MSNRQWNLVLPSAVAILVLCVVPVRQADGSSERDSWGYSVGAVSPVWIEYSVTGDAEVEAREEDVVMCSELEDGFKAHTLGTWNFTLEADGNGPGEHAVSFMVAPDHAIESLRSETARDDPRFYGDGTMTIESAGKDDFGLDLVTAEFSAVDLESATGHTISVTGKLGCQVL